MSAERYEVFQASDGWRWRLVAANGEIVSQSESYTRKDDAARGAADNQDAAADAEIITVEG